MKDEKQSASDPRDLALRTKQFALRAIKVFTALPKTPEARVLGRQMLRSATSVGAHYREARRAKSDADFVSKVEGALQELDETAYWLELLAESGIVSAARLRPLLLENDELIAILVSITKKAKSHRKPEDKKENRE
jgi:four helix bundle protein